MTDKKFTNEEIIKALELCSNVIHDCQGCPFVPDHKCHYVLKTNALDLINRQKAEYENLDTKLKAMRGAANSYKAENERLNEIIKNCHKEILQKCDSCNNRIKAEAYKEFAEKLKKDLFYKCGDINYSETCDFRKLIDNLLKEMVGEEE